MDETQTVSNLESRPYPALRRLVASLYGIYTWMVFVALVLCFAALATLGGQPARARRLARVFASLMFRLCGMPLAVTGLERLPVRPHVLLVNHTSFLDALALTALLPASPGYTFTTRQEFRLQSVLCPLLRSVHTIVLRHHRASGHTGNIHALETALVHGENLLVFPEGAFVAAPGLQAFHSGAFVAASATSVPLVVAGLRGARRALPLGRWLPRRREITLEIGAELTTRGTSEETIRELMDAAYAAMIPLTGEVQDTSVASEKFVEENR